MLSTWSTLFTVLSQRPVSQTAMRMRPDLQESKLFSLRTNALHCGTITPANESMTCGSLHFVKSQKVNAERLTSLRQYDSVKAEQRQVRRRRKRI